MTGSLFERHVDAGVLAAAADLRMTGSVVRDMIGRPDGTYGRAVSAEWDPMSPAALPGEVVLEGSLIDRGREFRAPERVQAPPPQSRGNGWGRGGGGGEQRGNGNGGGRKR